MSSFPLQHVSLHGHEVGYRRGGEGPVLLLIHGIAGSSRTWREVMPVLAERYTVIAPDLLGHGESAKPLGDYSLGAYASGMRDLLGVLGVERATVVGQSFGGGVAMQFAYQHPEWCERLVLVASGGLGREVTWLLRALSLPGSELLMPAIFPPFARNVGDRVGRFLNDRGVRLTRIAEMWQAYASLVDRANRLAFVRTLRAVVDPGGQSVSALDRVYLAARVPTLIIWGDRDAIIPVAHAHAAHAAIPGSRLSIIEGAGHFPHAEEPRRFIDALTAFLESTEPSAAGATDFRDLLLAGGRPPSDVPA